MSFTDDIKPEPPPRPVPPNAHVTINPDGSIIVRMDSGVTCAARHHRRVDRVDGVPEFEMIGTVTATWDA